MSESLYAQEVTWSDEHHILALWGNATDECYEDLCPYRLWAVAFCNLEKVIGDVVEDYDCDPVRRAPGSHAEVLMAVASAVCRDLSLSPSIHAP